MLVAFFDGYETFKLENSLISSVYPISSSTNLKDAESNESDAKQAMMQTVQESGKYWYNYSEYLFFSSLRKCFCCQRLGCCNRRFSRLERHEAASSKLASEIDIVKLLSVQRLGSFMAKLVLSKHQRALVPNFKQY